jgi:aldehyde dehydrogenase
MNIPMMTLEKSKTLAQRIGQVCTFGHFIAGEWVEGSSGETIELSNPANRETLAHIQSGNVKDVDKAVNAAYEAFPKWSRTAPIERQRILLAIAERLKRRQADFAMMETLNNGKTIIEAMIDIHHCAEQFEFHAGAAFQLKGEILDYADTSILVHREPIGVVAQIIPWNVALLMASMKLGPALAAGCTVVLKPAETVCLSVLEFIKDISDLLPPGVVNVVTGYGSKIGEALVSHPKVRKVTFTGSRATAQKIIQYASMNIIPQTMELGGKSANIVCEDADLDAAAESAVMTTILNKGEVCLAGTRVFVHKKVRDAFLDRFRYQLAKVRQGDPVDPATQLGAQSSEVQFKRVNSYIELGKAEGAVALTGGGPAKIAGLENGLFIEPTIFINVRNEMRIAQEEIFGPVTGVMEWEDEAELVRLANESVYGLGGGLWTRDLARAHRISRAIQTGIVWVNRYYNIKPGMPMGGYKQSGFGRENAMEAVRSYTLTKSVVINLQEGMLHLFDRPPADKTGELSGTSKQ